MGGENTRNAPADSSRRTASLDAARAMTGTLGDQHRSREHGVDDFGVVVEVATIKASRALGNAHEPVIRSRPAHLLNSPAPRAQFGWRVRA